MPFRDLPPPLTGSPVRFPTYQPGSERALVLLAEIDTVMTKGVLEIVSDPDPGFYSRLFLVEKSSGGWQPIIDLSPLNSTRSADAFQDGNTKLSSAGGQEERLPRLNRPQGRLLPDSSSSLLQEAPSFRLERYGLPIQSPMFRSGNRPASVHKSFRGDLGLGALSRGPPATIPG